MADGPFRFHGGNGTGQQQQQQFYYQQQQAHQRHLARNGSPVNGRPTYNNDTPSPSRSPVSQASTHNPYAMFNPGHQQGQHAMINGGNSHQRYMQMNMQHKYQHQPHQQHHGPQNHHHQQAHGSHQGHAAIGHQHTFSGGMLGNAGQNFPQGGLSNGTPNEEHDLSGEPYPEHWQQQLQLAAEWRQSSQTQHCHSKKGGAALASRGVSQPPKEEVHKDMEPNDGTRAVMVVEDQRQDWDGLDMSGQSIRTLSPRLFNDYTFLTKLYVDSNKLRNLPHEISQLRNLTHLQASSNQLREIPDAIGMLSKLRELLLFDNEIRTLPKEIGHLYKLEILGIDGNPMDPEIRDTIREKGTKALIAELLDRLDVGPPPPARPIIVLDDSEATETFTVLGYNILCDKAATSGQHGYSAQADLEWNYRREVILQEIKDNDADIVCLQEVEMESYNEFFRRELAFQHYKGVFWPRSRARTMADKEAKLVDGCAIFYKGQKFILLDKQLVDFSNSAINRPDMKGEHDTFNRVMPRDHIAVAAFFENRMTGSRLIVANGHIFWDPHYEDVKLVQTAILMEQLAKASERWATHPALGDKTMFRHTEQDSEVDPERPDIPIESRPSMEYSSGSQIPLILCIDSNSTKDSGVYELLSRGAVAPDHPDFGNFSYGNFTRDGVYHPFSLKSAYNGEPDDLIDFTNYTPGFSGIIDYIWYSPLVKVRQVLGSVDYDYLQKVPGFPNHHFPSDHLPLLAEFSVEPRKERPKAVEADFGPQRDRKN